MALQQPYLSAPSDEEIALMQLRVAQTSVDLDAAAGRRSKAQAVETKAKKAHAQAYRAWRLAAYPEMTEEPDDDTDD